MLFLTIELILYLLILTTGGELLVWSSFLSIVLCFLHALRHASKANALIVMGLGCTVLADLFLVVWDPIQRLWGMISFLCAQSLYALFLHRQKSSRPLLILRLALIGAAELITAAVLRENTDLLALISLAYYASLIMNILHASTLWKTSKCFPMALILFLLCDTVIGLQVASGGYLPIPEGSLLHRIIFMDLNLAWLFYLPSQVLICLHTVHLSKRNSS